MRKLCVACHPATWGLEKLRPDLIGLDEVLEVTDQIETLKKHCPLFFHVTWGSGLRQKNSKLQNVDMLVSR